MFLFGGQREMFIRRWLWRSRSPMRRAQLQLRWAKAESRHENVPHCEPEPYEQKAGGTEPSG
jgi:hypothetical protein